MKRNILIRGARQLLTLNGPSGPRRGAALNNLGLIEDGAVLVVNGLIFSVGLTRRVENLNEARSALEIDASGRVVMPGFIDSHTHLISGVPDSADAPPASALTETQRTLATMRAVRATPARTLEFQARRLLEAVARHGTTTIEAKSGHGGDEASELKIFRVLAQVDENPIRVVSTYLGAYIPPLGFSHNQDAYIEWVCSSFLPKVAARKLARFSDARCSQGQFTIGSARTFLQAARRLGLIPRMHAEQSSRQGSVRLAVEMAAASADGLNYASPEDVDLLARSSVIATILPADVQEQAADRAAPARALLDRGAAVAVASGFQHGVCPVFNMQTVISIAARQLKMTAAEAISGATINAAHALRIDSHTGSLTFGKDADLIMLNVADYREISYYSGVNLVSLTMRRGEILYREAEVEWPGK